MLEQALLPNYQLTETAAPAEQAQGLARWPVTCPPGAETTFVVHQRMETTPLGACARRDAESAQRIPEESLS